MMMVKATTRIGAPKNNLESPPVLKENELVVPLEVLSLVLFGRGFYQKPAQKKVWRDEVELFLEILLYKDFKFGCSLNDLKDAPFYDRLCKVLPKSELKYYGLYGQKLIDQDKVSALLALQAEPIVRNPKAPYAGATSLAESLAPLAAKKSPDVDLTEAKFYSKNRDAIEVGHVLNKLCRLAREGVSPALRGFEKDRDVQGVIWNCFEAVYSRACVKVERSFIEALLKTFRSRPAGLDYIIFQPLYQLVYGRDKSLGQLQPSVGMWLNLFGQQGSETSYQVHRAGEWVERAYSHRFYPLGQQWPFFLKHIEHVGDRGKYPGIYLFYKDEGLLPIGESSFLPANFPGQAFVLGQELYNLPSWTFPTLEKKWKGRAWNALVCPNPITKVNPKNPKVSKPKESFLRLLDSLTKHHYRWSSDITPVLQNAVENWAKTRNKTEVFEGHWESIFDTAANVLEKGRQVPLRLKAPLREVILEDSKRTAFDQGSSEQKATDTVLNIIAQTALFKVNEALGYIFSMYLPGATPLNVMPSLQKSIAETNQPTLFNSDVQKAFDSIDLLKNQKAWDDWLERCDKVAKKVCGDDVARALRHIFLPFVERVRFGFYANNQVAPGKTPLGLSLGPSFWLYISLPLAASFAEAKKEGDCVWATMTGDDTLAVFKKDANLDKIKNIFNEFASLGFSYHYFKNFDLNYNSEIKIERDGAFVRNWPKSIPIVHAGLVTYKHLIHILKKPEDLELQDLHRQAKFGILNFPTNILRFAQQNGIKNGTTQEPSTKANDRTKVSDASSNELAKEKHLRLVTDSPTTHGGLLFFDEKKLLPVLNPPSQTKDSEEKKALLHKTAQTYDQYLKSGGQIGDSTALYQGLRRIVVSGFPEIPKDRQSSVQSCFGDAEAVLLQRMLAGIPVKYQSAHASKMKIALANAKRGFYYARVSKHRGIPTPLVRLALDHKDLIFSPRQRQMAEPGTVLGPRFSIFFDVDDYCFKRSKQALQILGLKGSRTVAPSPNAELFGALCVFTKRSAKAGANLNDKKLGEEVIRMFNELNDHDKAWFKGLIEEHMRRAKRQDRNLLKDLEKSLDAPEGGYVVAYRAWDNSSVVQSLINA